MPTEPTTCQLFDVMYLLGEYRYPDITCVRCVDARSYYQPHVRGQVSWDGDTTDDLTQAERQLSEYLSSLAGYHVRLRRCDEAIAMVPHG